MTEARPGRPYVDGVAPTDALDAAPLSVVDDSEHLALDHARTVLEKLKDLAQLRREDFEDFTDEEFKEFLSTAIAEIYTDLFPGNVDGEAVPSPLNAENMTALVGSSLLNFEPVYAALTRLVLPGTDIPMFVGGGSFAVFARTGEARFFTEIRKGRVYGDDTDNPHNSAPYTFSKPAFLIYLRQMGVEDPTIETQESSDMICDAISVRRGQIHMGGIEVELPTGPDGAMEKVLLGISAVELSEAAMDYWLQKLRDEGAEHSIDTYKEGIYTAAGFIDEIAGRVAAAQVNGASDDELQAIANDGWGKLLARAIPGPLPEQCC